MTEYTNFSSINSINPSELAEKLDKKISEGWQPYGNVLVETQAHFRVYTHFIVKYLGDQDANLKTIKEREEEIEVLKNKNKNLKASKDRYKNLRDELKTKLESLGEKVEQDDGEKSDSE